ncbi:unnamed protein product [Malus baccata var. baccata]
MSTVRNNQLQGRVAIITGGASGIGEATARLFADHGATMVMIADIQDELGRQVAESIGTHRCSYVHCDVSDEEQVKTMVETTVHKYGQLDIMFSNAGIVSRSDQTVLDLDFSAFDRLFDVNVRGMALCVKHAALCTASVAANHGMEIRTDYCMSKHAVLGLVRSASRQLGVHGIRVNCVSPNALATPLTCRARGMEVGEVQKSYEKFACLKGVVLTPRHVADAVLFLACDDSEFVTGHDMVVDGGFVRQ